MATGREVKAGRLATATRREQQHNLSGMARILLNGDFTFCLICDFKELDVAKSPLSNLRLKGELMKRREFITLLGGTAAAWPLAAWAQSGPLIGVLSPVSVATAARNIAALRAGLRDLGYAEGRNIAIEFRFAGGVTGRLADLAAELIALKPEIIVAGSLVSILAVHNASWTIPIVMSATSEDPVTSGLAVSLARPGGNVTGFWVEGDETLIGKRIELLKDAVPGTSRIGVIVNPDDATDAGPPRIYR
jgi:putative ABC transport system substrate-binding protein